MQSPDEKNRKSTVDQEEIDNFNSRPNRWWGVKTVLHTMNAVRIPLIEEGLFRISADVSKPFHNKLVLEVGCGGGVLTEGLAKRGATIHGIDPCHEAISIAKEHASLNEQLSNLTYFVDTIENHAINNFQKYDAVIASEVIEHVTEKELFVKYCVECLKPGGLIFITTFNKTVRSWAISIVLIQEILNIIRRGTHVWDKFISPDDVSKILNKFNCKTLEVKGIDLNILTKNWSWSTNISTNYALIAMKETERSSM